MNTKYLSTKEVADKLGRSIAQVTRLVKQGAFPGTRKFNPTRKNSALSIPADAVDAFIDAQVISPLPDSDE